jgi:hypothetical protein
MTKTTRHYCIGADLSDLERLESELEKSGVLRTQIHVLTLDDAGMDAHAKLHDVNAFATKDLLRSGLLGLALGLLAAAVVLVTAYLSGWTDGRLGWMPFMFLAVVLLGFFTWEGGLWGFQTRNAQYQQFAENLQAGQHLMFADLTPEQELLFNDILSRHPATQHAGRGPARPRWLMVMQHRLRYFFMESMP